MKERMIPVTCPHCGHVFEIKRDTVLIADMDKIAEQRLESGSYFMHQCQNCKKMFYLYYPFLYHDVNRKFNLVLTQQKKIDNLNKNEKTIICHSVTDFILAYKIYRHKLNPRIVLKKKKQLEKKLNKLVKFTCYDELNQCLWFEDKAIILNEGERQNIRTL